MKAEMSAGRAETSAKKKKKNYANVEDLLGVSRRKEETDRGRQMECFERVLGWKGREEQLAEHYNPERGENEKGNQNTRGRAAVVCRGGRKNESNEVHVSAPAAMGTKWKRETGGEFA